MRIGTRSVLYGYHCWFLHPLFVALGWFKLHGFRRVKIGVRHAERSVEDGPLVMMHRDVLTSLCDPRLWCAFFLHDLGYWGCPNMDGDEGERHPFFAHGVMNRLFGAPWGTFCLYHSRFLAKREGEQPSLLCAPDKLAIALYPLWLFVLLVSLTGEVHEYMRQHRDPEKTRWDWARDVQAFARQYAEQMKLGGADAITGGADELNVRRVATDSGVYQ